MTSRDEESVGIEDVSERFIVARDLVRQPFQYSCRLPDLYNIRFRHDATGRSKLGALLAQQVLCPAEYVYTLTDVYLVSGKYVVCGDGTRIAETFRDADLSSRSRDGLSALDGARAWSDDARQGRVPVHIAKEGAANYGHTLTEILPRLVNLVRAVRQPVELILPAEAANLRGMYEEVSKLLGLDSLISVVEDGSLVHFETLVWAGPVSHYPLRKSEALLELADLILQAAPSEHPAASDYIYVGRASTDKRRPVNDAELLAAMQAEGYKLVMPAGEQLTAQASIFRNARAIVGPMGASFTNSIFATSECHVAMLDPGLVDLFYWDLANLRNQKFSLALVGTISEWKTETLLSNYTVDVDLARGLARELMPVEQRAAEGPAPSGNVVEQPPQGTLSTLSRGERTAGTNLAPCFWGPIDQDLFLAEVKRLIAPFGEAGAFAGDNMIVFGRNLSFLDDEEFLAAFQHYITPDNHVGYAIMWRLYTFCWAAKNGLRRPGDFVECGVFSGTSSAIMCRYLNFQDVEKKLYLYDVWDADERVDTSKYPDFNSDLFAAVSERFRPFPNVELRKGFIPESFSLGLPDEIAFLHIDLNNAAAEIAALDHLFDRVTPGGIILFDDYGSSGYRASKVEEDAWMARRGYTIMELPTSQGMVIR